MSRKINNPYTGLPYARSLLEPTGELSVQLARYFVAGGIAFIADLTTLFVLTEHIGINYLLASVCGFSIGLVINYLISIFWVFDQRSFDNRLAELMLFSIIGIGGLGLHSTSMWILTDGLGFHYVLSKFVSTALVFLFNFGARRYLVFNTKSAVVPLAKSSEGG